MSQNGYGRVLGNHHGGGMAGKDRSKVDWLCKTCKGKDGKPHRNFGFRTECLVCGLAKGVCFKSKVEQVVPTASSRSTLAEKQVRDAKGFDAAQRAMAAKDRRIAELQQQLAASKQVPAEDEQVDDDVAGAEKEPHAKIQDMQKALENLRSAGLGPESSVVKHLEEELDKAKAAKLAKKAPSAQLRDLEGKKGRLQRAKEKLEADTKHTEDTIASLQGKLAKQKEQLVENDRKMEECVAEIQGLLRAQADSAAKPANLTADALRKHLEVHVEKAAGSSEAQQQLLAILGSIKWQDLPGCGVAESEADKQSMAATEDMDLDEAFLDDMGALLASGADEQSGSEATGRVKEQLRKKQKEITQAVSALKVRKRQKKC